MRQCSSLGGKVARRSQRLALQIPLHIEYFIETPGLLSSETVTVIVSAHGALVRLPWGVPRGQLLRVQNLVTKQTQDATVAFVDEAADGVFDVGIEFTQPNPEFWGVSFPPEDWSPSHPDAKQNR